MRPEEMLRIKEPKRTDIALYNKSSLELFIHNKKVSSFSPVLHSYLNYLNNLAGAEKNNRNIQLLITVSLFFNTLLTIHREEFKEGDYRSYLIKEINRPDKKNYSQYTGTFVPITKDETIKVEDFTDILNVCFDKFYSATCYALVRLYDMREDYNLLVTVLQKLITSLQKNLIPAKVIEFLDKAIVKKSNTGRESIEKVFNDAYSMSIFEDVFQRRIFKNWGI
jgi:hypothetical protein